MPNPAASMGSFLGLSEQKSSAEGRYRSKFDAVAGYEKPTTAKGEPTCESEDHSFAEHKPGCPETLPGLFKLRNVWGKWVLFLFSYPISRWEFCVGFGLNLGVVELSWWIQSDADGFVCFYFYSRLSKWPLSRGSTYGPRYMLYNHYVAWLRVIMFENSTARRTWKSEKKMTRAASACIWNIWLWWNIVRSSADYALCIGQTDVCTVRWHQIETDSVPIHSH